MGGGISDFRSGEALGDHIAFRDKCGDAELRLELLQMRRGSERSGCGCVCFG